jgi:cysteine desulfurase family protein (TIGR01976 family)
MPELSQLVPELRQQFPALTRLAPRGEQPVIYLDGPAGSQVPQAVIDAVSNMSAHHNANTAGMFPTSQETSAMMANAHRAAADWFGTTEPRECVFGANMTTLTFSFSRALARTWQPGERIVVTELDHDGNVTPWRMAAEDAGVQVLTVRANPADATLDIDDFRRKVTPGVKLVAFTCASNSVGSRTPIAELVELAHRAGAEVYLDAVHYAPHGLIDVCGWQADYCVCSAYKFFGPHVGMLWGRLERLEELQPYKLRPSPAASPGKWMTGTQNFAAIAGCVAAIDYLASIGRRLVGNNDLDRRTALDRAFTAIETYERQLAGRLIEGLLAIKGVTIYGITEETRMKDRVPTLAMNIAGLPSREAAERLAAAGIYCWHGDYYAVDICRVLGQQPAGMVRLGIMHTTTPQEIDRTLAAVREIAAAQ